DPDGCLMEFLRDSSGVDLIWPSQMQSACNPKPFSYYVVKKFVTEGYDAQEDDHYTGDLRVMMKDVPMKTENEKYMVKMEDVRAWVLSGVVEEDSYVTKYTKKVAKLAKAMEILTKRIKTTANHPVFDDKGNEVLGSTADKEREDRYLEMSREREKVEEEHDKTKHELEVAMSQRIASKCELVRGNVDEASGRCTWKVIFNGINKERFENLVAHKTDWNGIRLAIGRGDREPYTGRGVIPDGSKPFVPDLREFLVNMHGVKVTRLEDGFGTYQELDRQSTNIRGKRFQYYHGTFREGQKQGYGIWYTDEGIYSGQVHNNQPEGKGRMDYANGDNLTGEFKVRKDHKNSLLGENPYARGEPNGMCTRTFADGSFYSGEMYDGCVTGTGTYINAMGERYDGSFRKGYFHGQGRFISVVGEVMEGTFVDGLLHGYGSYVNSRNDKYEGAFDRGEKHGKGMETFSSGNRFIGFFQDGLRLWHGETYYGNVKEMTGERGEVMLQMLRKEIERKKSKVFRQQRHLSKKNMYYAKEYEENDDLDEGILEGSTAYRKSTIENKINNNKKVVMSPRTIDEADMTPGLQFVDAQKMKKRVPRLFLESLEIDGKVQSEMGENPKHTVLAKLMQSDFEEMEERRRFINLDRKKQDIERILEKMYKAMSGEGGEEEGGK
ncbi:hypothetical protein TrRE_jg10555, partial [Triparma retinervis]